MHKIDRYGVIALVFMAVTFLAVYFWDDRAKPGSGSSRDPDDRRETARLEARPETKPQAPPHREASGTRANDLALTRTGGAPLRAETQRGGESEHGRAGKESVPRLMPGEVPPRDAANADKGRVAEADARTSERETPRTEDEDAATGARVAAATELAPKDPPASERAVPASRTYTVAKGDTLERIASRELGDGARWTEIQALNGGVDPKRLWVGKVLTLPGGTSTGGAAKDSVAAENAPPKTVDTAAAGGRKYVVKKGDILGTIAQKELGTVKACSRIVALNPGLDPDRLVVGMTLVLPAGAAVKPAREPLELANPSKSVARAEPTASPTKGGFKVR